MIKSVLIAAAVLGLVSTSAVAGGKAVASWYDCATPGQCSKSKRTANGERFNPNALTAAHRSYKFGTRLLVSS